MEYIKDLTILIVEDDEVNLELLARNMRRRFKKVYTAKNGKDGYAIWSGEQDGIDIILTDIEMPILNGIELIKKIRAISKKQSVIVLSAYANSSYLTEIINLGVDGFVMKPLEMDILCAAIHRVAKNIFNEKALDLYHEGLEGYFDEMLQKNKKYEKLSLILKETLKYINKDDIKEVEEILKNGELDIDYYLPRTETHIAEQQYTAPAYKNDKISAKEYLQEIGFDRYFGDINEDLRQLGEIANDMGNMFRFDEELCESAIRNVAYLFERYAAIIRYFVEFSCLSGNVSEVASFFNGLHEKLDPKTAKKLKVLIVCFISDLEGWKDAVFISRNAQDIHFFDEQSGAIKDQMLKLLEGGDEEEEVVDDTFF